MTPERKTINASVGEWVDPTVLKAVAVKRLSSTLSRGTKIVSDVVLHADIHSSKAVAENEATGLKNGLHDKDTMESADDSTKNVPLS